MITHPASLSDAPGEQPSKVHGAARRLKLDHVAREVTEALAKAGAPYILLKGPSIAHWLYPDGGREYEDIDLLVPTSDAMSERVLSELGFEPGRIPLVLDRSLHRHPWVRRSDGAVVDLHETLLGVRAPVEDAWRVLSRHVETMTIEGVEMQVLDVPGRAFYVAIHPLGHGSGSQPLEDLRRAIDTLPFDVWQEAANIARQLDAVAAFAGCLQKLGDGSRLAARLNLSDNPDLETELLLRGAPDSAMFFEWLSSRVGLPTKAATVIRKIFPPSDFMRVRYPAARRSAALLAVCYIARPFLILVKSLPGMIAWWRVRSSVRRKQSR